ncbi:uncharacterized protein zgc:193726 [Tachysurus ichikawai]
MSLPWSVSVLLLSSVLGFPVNYNNTGNFTRRVQALYCFLPTCNIHKLDEFIQKGDESADGKTQDPYGPGKK